MRGVRKMIDQEAYCIDILTQSLAVERSLSSLKKLVLENHLKTCVEETLSSSKPNSAKAKVRQELLDLYEVSNVRSK